MSLPLVPCSPHPDTSQPVMSLALSVPLPPTHTPVVAELQSCASRVLSASSVLSPQDLRQDWTMQALALCHRKK